jgi:FixJ family two-component response regulator
VELRTLLTLRTSGRECSLYREIYGTADKPKPPFVRELASTTMPAKPNSICVLDDNASVRKSIVQLLDSNQLKAWNFEAAEDFLAHASKHAVSVAILDVWMPKMNGLEVQARLGEMSPETKVIVMSANGVPETRAAALKAGAVAFLDKPFDAELFLFVVRQALRSASNDSADLASIAPDNTKRQVAAS